MKNETPRSGGVIFDMDGLMLDTERPLLPLWVQAGKLLGWEITQETAIHTLGLNGDDIRTLCMNELGPDFPYDSFREELERLANEEFEKGIALKPGLTFLLDHLRSKGIPLAVATSSERNKALWRLGKAGILDRFSVMVCGDEITRGKPDPDIFLLTAKKLGLAPSDCIGFEDSPAGLQALHTAGIRSVFVRDIIEPPDHVLSTIWQRRNNLAEAADLF